MAEAPPFGRVLEPTSTGHVEWALTVNQSPAAWTIDWRRPAEQIFDRARLQPVVAAWSGRLPLLRGAAAIRTERDWYLWQFDGTSSTWEAGAYRLENRVSMTHDPRRVAATGGDATDPQGHVLELVQAELAGARISPDSDQAHGTGDHNGV
ncbi:MAG: hypothetical protein EHM83_13430 [Burkholderiales bacterium]|nr:MAG: hypothetical protein EHM83_13430 [Burkholderiales bacterium]